MAWRRWRGWDNVRTALLASVVAMLVWVWAEGESVSRERRIEVKVVFASDANAEWVYRPDDPNWTGAVLVDVEGPRSATAAAVRELRGRQLRLNAGLNGMPIEAGPGTAQLDLAIRALEDVRRLDVAVVNVDPKVVRVLAQRMKPVSLPVRVELARPLLTDGEPTASPSQVSVRLPESVSTDGLYAVAFVSAEELDRVRGDGARTVTAQIRMPSGTGRIDPAPIFTPETVTVSLRIRKEVDTLRLPPVPVWFSLPPTEDGAQWEVEVLDKFLSDVSVTGPADQVDRIRTGEVTVKALVELGTDDLNRAIRGERGPAPDGAPVNGPGGETPANGVLARQVIFIGLPQGVAVGATNPIVQVRVQRRAASGRRDADQP